MKKQKFLAVTLVVIATLLLGVGYAALGQIDLTITGNLSAAKWDSATSKDFKVYFDKSVTPTTSPSEADSSITVNAVYGTGDEPTTATLDVSGLKSKGDVATATYTIKNGSNGMKATLTDPTVTWSNKDYFLVTAIVDSKTLAEDATTTVTVTVELINTPVTTEQNDTITITIGADPADNI